MKHFARHFLSVLLLLSAVGLSAASSSDSSGSSSNASSSSSGNCSGCDSVSSTSCSSNSTSSSESSSVSSSICQSCGSSMFLPRPQGLNSAALFNPYYYSSDLGDTCVTFTLGYRYEQTFHGKRIARCLFGDSNLVFSGSGVTDRADTDLMADYFGLPTNYVGSLRLNPRIQDQIFDFSSTIELGNWHECLEGLYFKFAASLVYTRWDLRPCAFDTTSTGATVSTFSNFDAGYMADGTVKTISSIRTALNGLHTFGDMQEQWNYGRFNWEHLSITRVANIDVVAGYDFLRCDSYHFGAFIKTVAPTGNRPTSQYVFEPIAGNGHHWELGGGLDAHWDFWQCDDQALSMYITGSITHLFKDKQWRMFDFVPTDDRSGCMSRYVLMKELNADGAYTGHLINAINFTTRKVKTSFDVQGDATLRFMYRNGGWVGAAGYNIYGRSKENISAPCCACDPAEERRFGIKGGQNVSDGTTPDDTTSSKSRMLGKFVGPDDEAKDETCEDSLCFKGVPSQIIHMAFASLDHQWRDCDTMPYLGVGAQVQIANNGKSDVCTPNKWGIWIRAGLSY